VRERLYGPGVIRRVENGSPADEAGLLPGDKVWMINGERLRDVIDYYLIIADDTRNLVSFERGGVNMEATLQTDIAPPGIHFEYPLFGDMLTCNNSCVFCFVDQLPAGLSAGLYSKDDDYRLSFLQGNFITLTNLDEEDIERIEEERLSPLYVSLHSTETDLREMLFRNKRAPDSLHVLDRLIKSGIEVHLQLVLLRGVNDGEHLDITLSDVAGDFSKAASVGVVPVGISTNGPVRLPLRWGYDSGSSEVLLLQLEKWYGNMGDVSLYAADEFFYLASESPPAGSYYQAYPQLENGIGLARLFIDGMENQQESGGGEGRGEGLGIVTSSMDAWTLSKTHVESSDATVITCGNSLFGPRVNVCGLMPGEDVAKSISKCGDVRRALVPDVAVTGGSFIDGISVDDVRRRAGVDVEVVSTEPGELTKAFE
jgi:putative radical SAM enzyme (TIGR03279 family)